MIFSLKKLFQIGEVNANSEFIRALLSGYHDGVTPGLGSSCGETTPSCSIS